MGNRRNPRLLAKLQVRIAGIDAHGRPLLQMVTTRNTSRDGALLDGHSGHIKAWGDYLFELQEQESSVPCELGLPCPVTRVG
jgi:hypothetical protein